MVGASVRFTADFETELIGRVEAGKPLFVTYDPARLPQCRGGLGGGHPAWNITGYVSQNGGSPRIFEPTVLLADGTDRVSRPVSIAIDQGGDVALWFQLKDDSRLAGWQSGVISTHDVRKPSYRTFRRSVAR